MKLKVQTMFLNQFSYQLSLLFLWECFLFEEHVEYLISERVIVYWHCHKQHHNNGKLSNHNCIISAIGKWASIKNDLWSLVVSWEVASQSDRDIEKDIDKDWPWYDFFDSFLVGIHQLWINREQLNLASVCKESNGGSSKKVPIKPCVFNFVLVWVLRSITCIRWKLYK